MRAALQLVGLLFGLLVTPLQLSDPFFPSFLHSVQSVLNLLPPVCKHHYYCILGSRSHWNVLSFLYSQRRAGCPLPLHFLSSQGQSQLRHLLHLPRVPLPVPVNVTHIYHIYRMRACRSVPCTSITQHRMPHVCTHRCCACMPVSISWRRLRPAIILASASARFLWSSSATAPSFRLLMNSTSETYPYRRTH